MTDSTEPSQGASEFARTTSDNSSESSEAQAVSMEPSLDYAGFLSRFLALCLDSMICSIPAIALNSILPFAGGFLVYFLYHPFFVSSEMMGTPGKYLLRLAVTDEQGQRLSFRQAFIRYLSSFLSGLLCLLGYFLALFTEKNQTLHDLIAKTVVIKKTVPVDHIFQAWWKNLQDVLGRKIDLHMPSSAKDEVTFQIEELYRLYKNGVLTEQEFQDKKSELLKKI